jgi:hypothetical protein
MNIELFCGEVFVCRMSRDTVTREMVKRSRAAIAPLGGNLGSPCPRHDILLDSVLDFSDT